MMANIKAQPEDRSNAVIQDAVIGRPVNFHGRGGEDSNQQAERFCAVRPLALAFVILSFNLNRSLLGSNAKPH